MNGMRNGRGWLAGALMIWALLGEGALPMTPGANDAGAKAVATETV